MKIGFLFNHYAPHQVPHAAPYAFELSRRYPQFEVIVACASEQEMALTRDIASLYPGHRCRWVRLAPPWHYQLIDPIVSKWSFRRKKEVLKHSLDFFAGLDALVAPERHCMKLRTQFGLTDLILIHTRHGAGDREGGFDDRSGAFDLTLLPGQKYADRLKELGHLADDSAYAVTGWPKFEVIRGLGKTRRQLFQNDNPVVVYNPHFDQRVSSWQPLGRKVLEWFAVHRDYNLIFAPHVVLFKRRRRHGASLPSKFRCLPNIHVDLGSPASADMTYMLSADIYLGDVSSQVYEFLLEPRPCLFLNGHGVEWRNNPFYFHWTLGQVIEDIDRELRPALDRAFSLQQTFLPRQQRAFAYTFRSEPDSTAAQRGADAIAEFLQRPPPIQLDRARNRAAVTG